MSFPEVPGALKARYEVQERVGSGGSATVYRAYDRVVDREVALKLYNPLDVRQKRHTQTKPQEAQLAGRVNHPNVVSIYDAGMTENRLFLVMQYLSGGSLRERIASHTRPLTSTVALQLIAVMAEALHEVHNSRILHLDIKPENIMFDEKGRPYLTDFGIAKLLDDDDRTKQTYAIGTGNYAAPEQQRHGSLSRSSDIFSLGVVLFELLTGYLPVGPAPPEVHPPYSPPFMPNDPVTASETLVGLLTRALRADPERRYASASDFGAAIQAYLGRSVSPTDGLRDERGQPVTTVRPVRFSDPRTPLKPLEARYAVPQSARALREDLVPVPPDSQVGDVLYSHQGIDIGRNALLKEPLFARGVVRLGQGTMARQDVISLSAIEVGSDVQANNLLAPMVTLHGSARIVGSIFCRQLGNGQAGPAPHIPPGTELGGSLVLEEAFTTLVTSDASGRPLTRNNQRALVEDRPIVRVASDCVMVAVLGDAHVMIGPQQRQLNAIRVTGDVTLGHSNRVQRVEGHNVHLEANCQVDEVRAHGTLIVEDGCTVGFARAGGDITLRGRVRLKSPLLISDAGTIRIRGEVQAMRTPLTPEHRFQREIRGRTGTVAHTWIDHPLYQLYEHIAPSWMPRLHPTSTDMNDLAPDAPEAEELYVMDLSTSDMSPMEPTADHDGSSERQTGPLTTEAEGQVEPPTKRWRAMRRARRHPRG